MTPETMLWRQVHPSFVQAGRITSQVFRPSPKDKGRLSVYDGDQITAEGAWEHYTEELEYESIGVMGVTVQECQNQDLEARPDPAPFPEHAVIDFSGFSGNQIKKKAKRLKRVALSRGWQYRAEDQS